jgi:hypothetical protein
MASDADLGDEDDEVEAPGFTWNAPARCQECGRGSTDPLSVAANGEACPKTGASHRWVNDETVWDEVGSDES